MVDSDNDRTPDEEGSEQARRSATRYSDLARGSRRSWMVLSVSVLSALLVAWLFFLNKGLRPGAGPLAPGNEVDPQGVSLPVDLGERISFGPLWIHNRTTLTAQIDGFKLIDASPGLKLLGAYVPPEGTDGVMFARSYPAYGADPSHQFTGSTAPTDQEFEVVFGFAVENPGIYVFRAIEIDYHVGSQRYSDRYPLSIVLCAPTKAYAPFAAPSCDPIHPLD